MPAPAIPEPPTSGGERITPIAAHPKFVPETPTAVDARVIEGLQSLGGGPGLLGELIESFGVDALHVMQRIAQSAAVADAAGFARGIVALQRAAGQLGGTQLCELLASLRDLPASELRQRGATHVQRLDAEIERLAAALREFQPAGGARQG